MYLWFFPLPSSCGWFPILYEKQSRWFSLVQLGPRNINILAGESVIRKEYPKPRDEAKMVTACMHETLFKGLDHELFPCGSVSYHYLRAQMLRGYMVICGFVSSRKECQPHCWLFIAL